jgi:hypothetical protein
VVSVTRGATSNQFIVRPVAAGQATVKLTDTTGDEIDETEQVDDVNETPEPEESETPEPSPSASS